MKKILLSILLIVALLTACSPIPTSDVVYAVGTSIWGNITGTLSNQTDLQNALNGKVPTSRTINGQPLTGDITVNVSVGSVEWGSINGTLSNQIDLQNALNVKVPTSTTVNGQTLSGNVDITTITGNAGTATYATNAGTSTTTNQTTIAYATNSGTSTTTNATHLSGDLATSNVTRTFSTGKVPESSANGLTDWVDRGFYIVCIANTTALATGNGTANITIPLMISAYNLVAVQAHVYTVSSSGTPTINIYNTNASQYMLSTAITIDANETDSITAAAAAVINTSYDDVAAGYTLRIDVTVAGTGTKGLDVILTFRKP